MADSVSSLRQLIEQRAEDSPGKVYLLDPDSQRELSFAALRCRAVALSALLAQHGLGPGDRVALLMPNGLDATALFLGVMAAGGVVTPLSLLAQPQQLAFMLDHSDCRLVFVAAAHLKLLHQALALISGAVDVEVIDQDWPEDAKDWALPAPAQGDDALLMYTSGTTGRPKGVRLSHGNLLAGAAFVSQAHGLGPDDRVLAVLPLYHINAQVVTVLAPLFHGGSLVMPQRFSTSQFWPLAERYHCTWLNLVPTMIAYLLEGSGTASVAARFCRSASAPLAPAHHRAFEARFGIGIIETMGLTETAAPVFTNPLEPGLRKIGSPGQAFGNQARVADPQDGRILPIGATGEIQILGANVMAGYHKDPEATAEAFTPDGWLRTGDLGTQDGDGFFFITGRIKELIIKGGENIAPREIDEALLKHPAVLEAAAFAVPDALYGQDIEAAVVLKPGQTVSEAELRAFCEQPLGRFKTPRAIKILAELPKGPSGKVQRLRLLDWE
jgi:long-chain acyl-CoA synthetase